MQTLSVSLPDELKEFVDEQVSSGCYASPSEYFRALVLADEKNAQDQLEAFLLEGIESGVATEMTRQDWENIRREGRRLVEARKRQKTA
jgi:antitoxin ParD1/3/4